MIALGFDLNANLAAILTLITAVATAGVTIINAIKNKSGFKSADTKLDTIHKQTNGTLSALRERIAALEAENARLDETNRRLMGDRRRKQSLTKKRTTLRKRLS